jgi:peptide deformylase
MTEKDRGSLVLYPDEKLNKVCEPVSEFTEELQEFTSNLVVTMYQFNALGIAAPQMGKLSRVLVISALEPISPENKMGDKRKAIIFVNPEIKETSGVKVKSQEACLSIPGVFVNLSCRYTEVLVHATDEYGKEFTMKLDGQNAISVQHEIAHLDGQTILDSCGPQQRKLVLKKYKRNMTKWVTSRVMPQV